MSSSRTPLSAHWPHGPSRLEHAHHAPPKSAAGRRTREPRSRTTQLMHSAAAKGNGEIRPRASESAERPRSVTGAAKQETKSAARPRSTAHNSRRPPSATPETAPSPPPAVITLLHTASNRKHEHERRRAEHMQKIQDLAKTIAALQLECAIEPSSDPPAAHIAPAADEDTSHVRLQRTKHLARSLSVSPTRKRRTTPVRPQSALATTFDVRPSSLPSTDPKPHYAAPTLASQLHQRNPIAKPKSKRSSAAGPEGSGPRHRQKSPTRTLPIPAAPTRPPPLQLKSLALLRKIKLDTDPLAKLSRPLPLALPRPFLGLSRLEDLGTRPVSEAGSGQDGKSVGVGRSARIALHKAIEAQLEDLYRELDSEAGVYGSLGKGINIADAVGPGFKVGIDDWALGADETLHI